MKRLLFIICALLFVSAGAFAQSASAVHQKTAQDTTGHAIPKALIKVCALSDTGCSVASTIYSDNAGTVKANPFTADVTGNYEFWASPGDYTVSVSKAGFQSYTYHTSVGPSLSGANTWTGAQSAKNSNAGSAFDMVDAGTGLVTGSMVPTTTDFQSSFQLYAPGVGRRTKISFWPNPKFDAGQPQFSPLEFDLHGTADQFVPGLQQGYLQTIDAAAGTPNRYHLLTWTWGSQFDRLLRIGDTADGTTGINLHVTGLIASSNNSSPNQPLPAAPGSFSLPTAFMQGPADTNNGNMRAWFGSGAWWDKTAALWNLYEGASTLNDAAGMGVQSTGEIDFINSPSDGTGAKTVTNTNFQILAKIKFFTPSQTALFANKADSTANYDFDAGSTTAQVAQLRLLSLGTVKWACQNDTGNVFRCNDTAAGSKNRIVLVTGAQSVINSGGSAGVQVNSTNSSGTGALQVYDGAATAAMVSWLTAAGRLRLGINTAGANYVELTPTTPTAARSLTIADGNTATVIPAALVTTAATTDNVTVTGMTSSGHCQLTPTNASAATNITSTFVSAKAANQITVTHIATASMNYDVMCTPN